MRHGGSADGVLRSIPPHPLPRTPRSKTSLLELAHYRAGEDVHEGGQPMRLLCQVQYAFLCHAFYCCISSRDRLYPAINSGRFAWSFGCAPFVPAPVRTSDTMPVPGHPSCLRPWQMASALVRVFTLLPKRDRITWDKSLIARSHRRWVSFVERQEYKEQLACTYAVRSRGRALFFLRQ